MVECHPLICRPSSSSDIYQQSEAMMPNRAVVWFHFQRATLMHIFGSFGVLISKFYHYSPENGYIDMFGYDEFCLRSMWVVVKLYSTKCCADSLMCFVLQTSLFNILSSSSSHIITFICSTKYKKNDNNNASEELNGNDKAESTYSYGVTPMYQ